MTTTTEQNGPSGFPTSRYIHLNVGGKVYMTSQETLTRFPESMLGHMFTQERIPLAKDEQGRFLIDRDGKLFRYILNFLRGGKLCLPEGFDEHSQLLEEARFYQIDGLVKKMSVNLNVGGVRYTTTKAALTSHHGSRLAELFPKKPVPLDRDQDGFYIIKDGDGPLFRYILNFLEDDDLHLPEYFDKFAELEREAKRYKLEAITRTLKVCLVVNDREYHTTRAILTEERESLLGEIFTRTPIALERDQLGRFIFEPKGTFFPTIFGYMNGESPNLIGRSYQEIEAEIDYYKIQMYTPDIDIAFKTFGYNVTYFSLSWKNLTKYKGSLLEEKFAEAKISKYATELNGDVQQFKHIVSFLETGNLANIPLEDYPRLVQEARCYRLNELERLLTADQM